MKTHSSVRGLQPPKVVVPGRNPNLDRRALLQGLELLQKGKVACILVAGGQATRLGISQPKGLVDFLGKSLYQIYAEEILKLSKIFVTSVPFYVMTSPATHKETVRFFRKHKYFGLSPKDIRFFQQGTAATTDRSGKELYSAPRKKLENPDGHGGLLEAARKAGIFADAKKRGIRTLFYFQVDNPLVYIADPLFLGYHELNKSVYSLKIIRKREPGEKLGLLCKSGSKLCMVEYSELSDALRNARRSDGSLKMDAGSIAIHIFDLNWMMKQSRLKQALPWHQAEKKVKAWVGGKLSEVDAIKKEKFIFDLLPKAGRTLVLETSREFEFAPIKNASGPDSLDTSVQQFQKVRTELKKTRLWL